MKFGFRTPSLKKRIAARTSPALAGLLLVAFLAGPAFAQSASVYGPRGAYMGRIAVNPQSLPPGAIPAATPEGISVGAQECPKERPSDSLRKYLPAGMEMAPGIGICDGRREDRK